MRQDLATRTGTEGERRGTSREFKRLSARVAVCDDLLILAAFLIAYLIRFGFVYRQFDFIALMVISPPVFVAIMASFRLYSLHRFTPAEEFRRIFYAVTVGITAIVTVSYWTKAEVSREWVALSWILAIALLLIARRFWHHYIRSARERGRYTYRTLIVGSNEEAAHLASIMAAEATGYEVVGFVSTAEGARSAVDAPILGSVAELDEAIAGSRAECVFVASSSLRERDMARVTQAVRRTGAELRVSANIPEVLSTRLSAQPIGGVMAFAVWPVKLSGPQAATKRIFDLLVGAISLVITLPIWGVIAIVVGATSRGGVIYRQPRVGKDGRPFIMWKFRTMVTDPSAERPDSDVAGPLFKARRDPRVTRVGRFLRRWSLDEMPQLVNVLIGQMSLVGPRPPLASEVAKYEDWQSERLVVKPGMTGLWQVSGRSDLSFDDYVRLDLFYIENWSLSYDLYLMARTIPTVLSRRGAF